MQVSDEILYMLGVVLVGTLVTFLIRAVPFILFAGKNRPLPAWVEKFGAFISPIIILGLIVYSYTGLEWKTFWPYLAGALTIALQIWKGNALVSILAGTILYMVLISCCGCTGIKVDPNLRFDSGDPAIALTRLGVKFGDQFIDGEDAPKYLEAYGVPKDETIYILVEEGLRQNRLVWVFQHNILGKAGYRRSMIVSERKVEYSTKDTHKPNAPQPKRPPKIRYKKAHE